MSGVGFLYSAGLWRLHCGDFTQWVGLDDWLVKVSWLGKLVSVFWCVEMDFFSLECPVMSFAMGLCVRCDFGQPVC